MSDNNQERANSGIFNKFISVVALIAAALYFTGWIYRWSYFSFFKVNLLSLDLGVQSYYIAAFQALFAASPLTALKTILAVFITFHNNCSNFSHFIIFAFCNSKIFKEYSYLFY